MRRALFVTTATILAVVLAACTGAAATPVPTVGPSVASIAPTVAPSVTPAPTPAPSATPSATPDACAAANLKLAAAGKLTIGTDNPAYPPYYQIPAGTATAPWELGDPTNGQGFESAFAYALATQLGFTKDQVVWTVVPFDNAIAPGVKAFDIDINQVSASPEKAAAVDLSDGYYTLTQSLVALKANPLAKVTSLAALKAFKFGAQVGTTSLATINTVIAPTTAAKVYNTNDDAIAALKAKQIDGLIVDLPTAFYVTAAQVDGSVIVGQFAPPAGADAEHFSVLLTKGSSLTTCVNAAIAALKSAGTLDSITTEWLADKASAPVFQP